MGEYILDLPDFQLSQADFLIRLLVACGIGFLIGFEREHSAILQKEARFAGTRTFVFLVLLGSIATLMFHLFGVGVFLGILFAVVAFIGISYWSTSSKGDIGGTTEFSALIAFFLGCISFAGYIELSLVITVVVLVMLSAKLSLRNLAGNITQEELYDFIRFSVAALLIFPFLPDESYGPNDAINPREVGWVVLLVSGIGFVGYLLIKFLGPDRGIILSGILGGLVSSTMVTWVFAKKSKETPALSPHCSTAILTANAIMVVRVFLWVQIFNPALAPALYLPLGVLLLPGLGITLYYYLKNRKATSSGSAPVNGKALNMRGALWFALAYTLIVLLLNFTHERFGQEGFYLSSFIAGLTDVDAISVSVSKMAGKGLEFSIAENAILIAILSNTLVKMGITVWAGSKEIRPYAYIGFGSFLVMGVLSFLIF
jgi:uncharacterized membrane protein (DUF4010 family)